MTVLEHALTNLAEFLKDQKIPYMVIGGFANIIWGEPRATIDIDVTIWVSKQDIENTISVFEGKYKTRIPEPSAFVRDTHVLPLESREGVYIDIIFGSLPYEEDAINRAIEVDILKRPVRFCSPEDLILHKIISDRDTDLADVRGVILRQIKTLDLEYIEPRIQELSNELARTKIWDYWIECKNRAQISQQ